VETGNFARVRPFSPITVFTEHEAQMEKQNGRIVETPVEARAGFLDRPVLVVLVVSATAAVIALILTYVGVL
jgi:hypothetical protein